LQEQGRALAAQVRLKIQGDLELGLEIMNWIIFDNGD